MSEHPIERPVKAGETLNYAHPANLPLCMVHGHQSTEDERGKPIEVPITVWPLGRTKTQIGALRLCVICGTAYGVL